MPSNSKIIFFVLCLLVCSLLSCESDFEVKTSYEKKMVLNADITPTQNIKVLLTENRSSTNNNALTIIKDALMTLTVNDTLMLPVVYTPNNPDSVNNSGYYIADYMPKPEDKITLHASHPNFPTVSSTEYLPSPFLLTNYYPISHPIPKDKSLPAIVHIEFDDPAGSDYYLLDMWYIYSVKLYDSIQDQYYFQNDYYFGRNEEIDGLTFTPTLWGNNMFDDHSFENQKVSFNVKITNPIKPKSGNKLYLYIDCRRVSLAYFLYEKTFALSQDEQYNPFKEPVFVYNNVQNGYGVTKSWVGDFRQIVLVE